MPNSSNATGSTQPTTTYGMNLADDALVTFGVPTASGTPFQDTGYMPITSLTIGANALPGASGLNGMFISYTGTGVETATGIDYSSLTYQLIGYTGDATFSHNPTTGAATVTGATHEVVLATGSLISGALAFNSSGGIGGDINVTEVVGAQRVGSLDIAVQHSAGDIGGVPNSANLTLSGGTSHATFVPLANS